MAASIRLRILRLLLDKEEASAQSGPDTAGEIARALDEPLRSVVRQLRTLEAAGLVELAAGTGQGDENVAIRVKPPARVYLNANEPPE
jgi:DNA-binding transcriptional ArsR family regulator